MKPEEINIEIAEACGCQFCKDCNRWHVPDSDGEKYLHSPPDYFNDLNAISGAVRSLPKNKQVLYTHNLLCICVWTGKYPESDPPTEQDIRWGLATATSAQMAVAFVKTIEEWIE